MIVMRSKFFFLLFLISSYCCYCDCYSEISTLLTEVNDLKMELSETQRNVERKEKEILKIHETVRNDNQNNNNVFDVLF